MKLSTKSKINYMILAVQLVSNNKKIQETIGDPKEYKLQPLVAEA